MDQYDIGGNLWGNAVSSEGLVELQMSSNNRHKRSYCRSAPSIKEEPLVFRVKHLALQWQSAPPELQLSFLQAWNKGIPGTQDIGRKWWCPQTKWKGKQSRRRCSGVCLEMVSRYTSSEAYVGEALMKATCNASGGIKSRLQLEGGQSSGNAA